MQALAALHWSSEAALYMKLLVISVPRMMQEEIWPSVSWSEKDKGLAYIARDIGQYDKGHLLRFVGRVIPESYGGHNCFDKDYRSEHHTGWFTNPDGICDKDGYGLVWGVVCQLTGHKHRTRLVAGYQFGGCDGGPTIDFSRIFWGDPGESCSVVDSDAAREAARYADDMAKRVAEDERIYQEEQREDEDEDEDEDAA
jgi:hypothetical protein